jgi:N-acetylglucosamine-6-phosphate deacetylase
MNSLLIRNAALAGGKVEHTDRSVLVENGRIAKLGSDSDDLEASETLDLTGGTLFPGFIDVHIHGAVGVDVNAASAEDLLKVAAFLARSGVTAWMPTLVPDSDENYRRVIAEIDRLMEVQQAKAIAQAVGVHYEGVFANEKMCGALRSQYFKKFTGGEVLELPRLKRGVHMTTFAPEIDGGVELAAELSRHGWIASIGHTRADVDTLDAAFAAGARHMTHFFNAMTGVHHREVGVAGWGLSNKDVTFDIIADGVHVHPTMLEMACRTKGPANVTLISDSVAPTGMGDGEFEIWGEKVAVRDLQTCNERGSIAGSVITMHDAFLRMRSLGSSDAELAAMTSANPAKLLGLADSLGSIEAGKRADLVAMRADGSIEFVMIGGEFVDLG